MKRSIIHIAAATIFSGLMALGTTVQAQTYPARPVRLVVGFATGGGTDVLSRIIARKLADTWAHPLVVDNRPIPLNTVVVIFSFSMRWGTSV